MFKPKTEYVMSLAYKAAVRRMAPLNPVARRQALERAQSVATSLERAAEAARIASLTPAERAYELGEKAQEAKSEANRMAYAMTEAATLDAARPKAPASAHTPSVRPGASPPGVQTKTDVVAEAAAAVNARAVELTDIHRQAAKLGVDFDLEAALASRMSPRAARDQVFDIAAERDEALVIKNRSTSHTAEQANAGEGWDRSLQAVTARRGLKVREPME